MAIAMKSISEAIREQNGSTLWRTGGLVRDFEDFNFLHLKMR
jgi:hypothetical protein